MKLKFIGDPLNGGAGPAVIDIHGVKFPKGQAVEVDAKHPASRMAKNNHFEVVKDAPPPSPKNTPKSSAKKAD